MRKYLKKKLLPSRKDGNEATLAVASPEVGRALTSPVEVDFRSTGPASSPQPDLPVADPHMGPELDPDPNSGAHHGSLSVRIVTSQQLQPTSGVTEAYQPRARISCLDQATERLKRDQPEAYAKLEDFTSKAKSAGRPDPEGLLNIVMAKRRDKKDIPRAIETSIRYILQFKDIGIAAANLDPYKAVPIVWRGVCLILETCISESALNREELVELEKLTCNLAYWANVELFYLGSTQSASLSKFYRLEPELTKFHLEILTLEVKLLTWISNGRIVQFLKTPERSASWKELVRNITSYHDACKVTLDRCKMEIDQNAKVKKWISEMRPEQAHDDALDRTQVAQKYRDCGQWLLNHAEFKSWSSSTKEETDCRILWLRGTAGTGKSTLMCRINQWHLDTASLHPDTRFAYFYCSRGADMNSKHSYISVLQAILRQAAYDPATGTICPEIIDAYTIAGGDSADLQSFNFTRNWEPLFHSILKSNIKLRIMIDALDECDKPRELLRILRRAYEVVPGGLDLLVSSRYEVHVHDKFPNAVMIDVRSDSSKSDMDTYIDVDVYDRDKDDRLLEGKYPDLERRLVKILRQRAGGMFRWVQLQLSFLLSPSTPLLHPKSVQQYLDKLNTGSIANENDLNMAYDNIFRRNTGTHEIEHDHARKIYKLLLCSRTPMSIAMITETVAASEHDNHRIDCIDGAYVRRLTEDFVVEHPDQGRLEFAHVSVKDYLQGEHQSEYSKTQCHAEVALMCINHISSQQSAPTEETLRNSAFLQYAHENWKWHCFWLSESDRQTSGVSKELLEWIFGSGSKTFDLWSSISPTTIQLSKTSGRPYLLGLVFLACRFNLIEVLRQILSKPPTQYSNISTKGSEDEATSAESGKSLKDNVKLLSMTDEAGQTPLICALNCGYIEVVKFLVEKGVDVKTAYEDKYTPLHMACKEGYADVGKLLIETGADINAADEEGETPLHSASRGRSVELVKVLIEKGADVNVADTKGNTPLSWASEKAEIDVVELLIKKGANVNVADIQGWTPLFAASCYDRIEVVELLIEKGAGVNVADVEGKTPLFWASMNGYIELVELLIKVGATTNVSDVYGWTPLDWASDGGHVEVVKILERDRNA